MKKLLLSLAPMLLVFVAYGGYMVWRSRQPQPMVPEGLDWANDHKIGNQAVILWGGVTAEARAFAQNLEISNLRPVDYAGPESCKHCHEKNHRLWSAHAHRRMNAVASDEMVLGDFSGGPQSRIHYCGGIGTFYRDGDRYLMKLSRGGLTRVFMVNRTLGSRIQQYYLGTMIEGPEPRDHPSRLMDYVLPFGFELTRRHWVPLVHVTGHDGPDFERDDPFELPSRTPYDSTCSMCHTTHPMGNQMLMLFSRFALYTPRDMYFAVSDYLDESYPGEFRLDSSGHSKQFSRVLAQENAVHAGIGCEACHHGAKAHVDNEHVLPAFFPAGKHVFAAGHQPTEIWGRTPANINFVCARCHSGNRPTYAAGMATWNSTEYSDALRGACYHPNKVHGKPHLTCITCHNPHEGIGRRWPSNPTLDNAQCIGCHTRFEDDSEVRSHTHHAPGGVGSECMNCHMPRINEGMGDLVRTHMIFSPTNVKMIEANQPNACNMCHVDKSIDWTLGHLAEWYRLRPRDSQQQHGAAAGYSDEVISRNYPSRVESAAVGWLSSSHSATRLVAADVLLKAKARWALPQVIRALDDPYFVNRLFTLQRLEDYLAIYPQRYGYEPHMTASERVDPIRRVHEAVNVTAKP